LATAVTAAEITALGLGRDFSAGADIFVASASN
jgi:hypothetical protein